MEILKAPFPYFGGKSSIAPKIWELLGNVGTYIEPFCGSAAILLQRPHRPTSETINDANGFIVNFWRAVQASPDAVAHHADWPSTEVDLAARYSDLHLSAPSLVKALKEDARYFDPRIAGWWVWGQSSSILGGWSPGAKSDVGARRIDLGNGWSRGRGVHKNDQWITCGERSDFLKAWMAKLSDRLRSVRVCCGDWRRVCNSDSAMFRRGTCGVFLDPPYSTERTDRNAGLYETEAEGNLHDRLVEWCSKWCQRGGMRIVLCGLEGEYDLDGWRVERWKSRGNFKTASRERLWISPGCVEKRGFDWA